MDIYTKRTSTMFNWFLTKTKIKSYWKNKRQEGKNKIKLYTMFQWLLFCKMYSPVYNDAKEKERTSLPSPKSSSSSSSIGWVKLSKNIKNNHWCGYVNFKWYIKWHITFCFNRYKLRHPQLHSFAIANIMRMATFVW